VERHTDRSCHFLAFLNQPVQQVPQIREFRFRSKVGSVRKSGQSRNTIYRRVKDELRPLSRTRILQGLCVQVAFDQQIGGILHNRERRAPWLIRAKPSGRVQLVLHVRIAVARSAHEGCSPDHVSPRVLRDDLFAAQTILRRNQRAFVESLTQARQRLSQLCCLGGDNS
jgi:hypothetical protein